MDAGNSIRENETGQEVTEPRGTFKHGSRTETKMSEADLNLESTNAATEYLRKMNAKALPMTEQSLMINSCASGFFMGVRFAEKRILGK